MCLGKVAYQLLALVDILEGVHAGLPRPSDMADREEGRKPYDRATDVLATIECVLEDELRPAIISLQRSAPRQPAADHEGDRPADRDPVRDGAPGRGADPGRDEGDEDGTLPPARRPLVSARMPCGWHREAGKAVAHVVLAFSCKPAGGDGPIRTIKAPNLPDIMVSQDHYYP